MFRLEDSVSYPSSPYAFGCVLKKIFIKTTDDQFKESSDNIAAKDINHKLIKMEGLSVFLDYGRSVEDISIQNKILPRHGDQTKKLEKYLGSMCDFYTYCLSEVIMMNFNLSFINILKR